MSTAALIVGLLATVLGGCSKKIGDCKVMAWPLVNPAAPATKANDSLIAGGFGMVKCKI